MKLISVQSRGDRLAIVQQLEILGSDFVLTRKKFGVKKFKQYRFRAFAVKESALKAAEKWLEGAEV